MKASVAKPFGLVKDDLHARRRRSTTKKNTLLGMDYNPENLIILAGMVYLGLHLTYVLLRTLYNISATTKSLTTTTNNNNNNTLGRDQEGSSTRSSSTRSSSTRSSSSTVAIATATTTSTPSTATHPPHHRHHHHVEMFGDSFGQMSGTSLVLTVLVVGTTYLSARVAWRGVSRRPRERGGGGVLRVLGSVVVDDVMTWLRAVRAMVVVVPLMVLVSVVNVGVALYRVVRWGSKPRGALRFDWIGLFAWTWDMAAVPEIQKAIRRACRRPRPNVYVRRISTDGSFHLED